MCGGLKIDVQVENLRIGDVSELVIGDSNEVANALGWKAKFTDIDDIVRHVWNRYCASD